MVVRVLEAARKAREVDEVLVATDDSRIAEVVEAAGGAVVMTEPGLASGTDRVYSAAKDADAAIVLNVQGDEPLLESENLDIVTRFLRENPNFPMATVAFAIDDPDEIADPNVVKVVRADDGRALYFSRSPLPYRRRPEPDLPTWKHLGLYGYRKEALAMFTSLPPHPLEQAESLEQLRALAAGLAIAVLPSVGDSIGVDTPADIKRVEERLRARERRAGR